MSKLANNIALFCKQDNTGYLVKHIDPWTGSELIQSLDWIRINSIDSKLFSLEVQ
jgi:hypothetical protein